MGDGRAVNCTPNVQHDETDEDPERILDSNEGAHRKESCLAG
jgi:hypothetical protein